MNKKRSTRGFTLIELLVVIAIIGILSSVVLASLNTARGKGADASIKSQLANIRAQAEIYYDGNTNSYGTQATTTCTSATCTATGMFSDTTIINMVRGAYTTSGANVYIGSGANYWGVAAALKTSSGNSWCVDSTGASKQITTPASNAAFTGC